jgi:hypothetical protein
MATAFLVFGVPILALIIVAIQFQALEKIATPQRLKFSMLEILLPLLAFGAFMVSIYQTFKEPGPDQTQRIVTWAVYLFIACAGMFLICMDCFRRSTLHDRSGARLAIVALGVFSSPVTMPIALLAWMHWTTESDKGV